LIFNKVLTSGDCSNRDSYFRRQVVRAVVFKDDKLLLINTNKGDYKFPGGGIEQNESHSETLTREVIEETGYHVDNVNEPVGIVIERKPDKFDSTKIFEMTSYYYLCDIGRRQVEQTLDEYEAEQGFKPVWISLNEALAKNKELIEQKKNGLNPWVIRETIVMQELKSNRF